jgi:hypothetical protein
MSGVLGGLSILLSLFVFFRTLTQDTQINDLQKHIESLEKQLKGTK